jgi:enoyl-[acyl-carrier protein] reductase I
MGLLDGKKGLIFGVANNKSIAWGIAEAARKEGAELAFTYLNEALERRVRPIADSLNSERVYKCDVQSDSDIQEVADAVKRDWGSLDFIVHSVAYASSDDLRVPFHQTSREGFKLAMDVSAYSLVAITQKFEPLFTNGGSILTLSYYGAEKVVPHYRVMGVAKAALEASVKELAVDLGPKGIRVNCISAGPIKTLAATGIADFRGLLNHFEARSPMRKLITIEDVGLSSLYFLSELSRGVTGEVSYVDGGFNVTAA